MNHSWSDLHTHTTFSDGKHTVEEMVQWAISKNMSSIGISDHSFTPFDQRYCMKEDSLQDYLKEIRRVGEKYSGQIEVYAGLEYDGYSVLENRADFDYLIGDCHYIKTWDGYHSVDHAKDEQWAAIEAYFNSDPMAYARAYYDTYVQRTQCHRPDVLGHFDVVVKHGHVDEESRIYRKMAMDALIACLEVTPIVEMNTGPVVRKWRKSAFPDAYLLKTILSNGGKIIFSSDSHQGGTLAGWFDEAAEVLRTIGFRSTVIFRGGKFEEVSLG